MRTCRHTHMCTHGHTQFSFTPLLFSCVGLSTRERDLGIIQEPHFFFFCFPLLPSVLVVPIERKVGKWGGGGGGLICVCVCVYKYVFLLDVCMPVCVCVCVSFITEWISGKDLKETVYSLRKTSRLFGVSVFLAS